MKKKLTLITLVATWAFGLLFSQEVNVDINFNIKHSVDGVSDFGRERHITLHSSATEGDWVGHEDMMDYLINDLDVYFGRDNGSAGWKNGNTAEDPDRANWPDVDYLKSYGNDLKNWYESDDFIQRRQYESKSGPMIMGMIPHPNYPTLDWNAGGPGRVRANQDDEWQVFDVKASAYWMAHYLDNHFSKNDDEIGEPLPTYWECINEPDMEMFGWHKMFVTSPELLWEYHNETARIFEEVLGDAAPKIGGMTWGQHDLALQDLVLRQNPQFYIDNGDDRIREACTSLTWDHRGDKWWQWDGLFQGFIDNCGENMDFYSVHIYDWPQVDESKNTVRAGGHTEAMLDLFEWYDLHKFGTRKEIVISEFGSVGPGVSELPYKQRDWGNLRPFNQMMMQFLERPSHLTLTMPFAPVKAQWGDQFNTDGSLSERYTVTMMDPVGEYREDSPGARYNHKDWEWSKIILWYELWSDVKGTRIDTKSSDRDIQVDAYVDGNHVYLILNNLEVEQTTINLNYFDDYANEVKSVHVKHQHYDETTNIPVNDEAWLAAAPGSVVLDNSATMILDYEFTNPVNISQESKEVKFPGVPVTSATTFLGSQQCHVSVSGRAKFTTQINNVTVPTVGEATLRIGVNTFATDNIEIVVNGHMITGENDHEDWRGRERVRSGSGWYGVFEQDIPLEFLQTNNTIEVINHRHNSEYSTFMLQVWDFTKEPGRSSTGTNVVAVNNIAIEGENSVKQGESLPLGVNFIPANATNKGITWVSSNPSVATVDEFGVVRAVASSGSTTITATSKDNGSVAATKTINAAPYSAIAVSGVSITNGTSIVVPNYINTPLEAVVSPANATVQNVVWSSSNPDEVYVNASTGKITGKKVNANAIITATVTDTESGNAVFTDNINVHVTIDGDERVFNRRLPEVIRPFPESELDVDIRTMGARSVQVELSRSGSIVGQGSRSIEFYGDTTLTIPYTLSGTPQVETNYDVTFKLYNGSTLLDSRTTTVYMADHYRAESIQIIDGIRAVQTGRTLQVKAEVLPENTYNKGVTWNSSNTSVATIGANTGIVNGVSVGSTTITARSDDGGFTDQVTITVQSGPVHVYVDTLYLPEKVLIFPGQSTNLAYTFYPPWATDTLVNWGSNAVNIANVDANGRVTTGSTLGNAIITVTSANNAGITASTNVSVSETIVVEAEDFDVTGGEHDGFQKSDVGINHNQSGDWADYNVNFPAGGNYEVTYYIGVPDDNTDVGVNLYLDGALQSTTSLSSTGGYDIYNPFSAVSTVSVSQGLRTVRIESTGSSDWQWNMERFEFSKGGSSSGGSSSGGSSSGGSSSGGSSSGGSSSGGSSSGGSSSGGSSSGGSSSGGSSSGGSSSGGATITLEAEDYSDMGGVNQNGTLGGKVGTVGSITYMYEIINTDWLEYTFNVATAGTYDVSFIAASDRSNQNIQYLLDNAVVATQAVTQTGSATTFGTTNASTPITLSAGEHTLKLVASGTYIQWNLDKTTLTIQGGSSSGGSSSGGSSSGGSSSGGSSSGGSSSGGSSSGGSSSGGSSSGGSSSGGSSSGGTLIPGKVEAESYSAMSGIQTQSTSDVGGGDNVGWINSGDWLDYEVNVQTTGTYTIDFRVASLSNNIKLDLKNGNTVITSVDNSTTNGWQNWTTVRKSANLTAGQQTLRVEATGSGWNINWIEFTEIIGGSSSSGGSSSGGSSSGGSSSGGSSSGGSSSGGSSSGGSSSGGSTITIGNPSNSDATHDGWKSNMVINETDTYTNNSGSAQTIQINTFNFYAWRNADPVTPFVVRVNGDNNFTVLAVGTTRANSAYNVGNNSVAFNTGTAKTITLNNGEVLATGFLDANANGTGGSTGSVIPFDGTSPDQIWYTGGSASDNSGQVSEGTAPTQGSQTLTHLTRNYHYNIECEVVGGSSSGGSSSGGSSSGGSSSGGSSSGGSSSGGSSSGGSSSSGCTGTVITVEAESFISTGGTFDDSFANGPGLGAGKTASGINYVNNGDWMDYTVNVPASGTYSVAYQISSPITGSTIQITAGSASNTTTVPNNGQWDNYVNLNASANIDLNAGSQTIRLTAGAQTWTWNLDKFTLTCASKGAIEANELTEMSIYPNPVNNQLNIIIKSELQHGASIMIYNSTGTLVSSVPVTNNELQFTTSHLQRGMYIIKFVNGVDVATQRFIKE